VPARRTPGRRRLRLPRASSTPGQVRLIRAGLVVLCLGWGALAALMVGQHASAAGDATSTSEPLSLDAQQMYQSLADADVTVSTGYLFGRVPPQSAASAAGPVTAAGRDANAWFAVNQRAQTLDAAHQYADETNLVIGTAGTLFGHLEDDLGAVIHADQAVFAASAAAGSGAFSGLQIGIAVLALAMAAGCAWGLSRRLAEYR
jgi:hypothetical protein